MRIVRGFEAPTEVKGDQETHEAQGKRRPALVVQNDVDNARLQNTVIAQITSNLRRVGDPQQESRASPFDDHRLADRFNERRSLRDWFRGRSFKCGRRRFEGKRCPGRLGCGRRPDCFEAFEVSRMFLDVGFERNESLVDEVSGFLI